MIRARPQLGDFDTRGRIVSIAFGRLGATPPAENLLEMLLAEGAACLVATYGTDDEPVRRSVTSHPRVRLVPPGIRATPRPLRSLYAWTHLVLWLWRTCRPRARPALLITNNLGSQAAAWLVSRLRKVPFACHVHEVEDGFGLSRFNRFLFSMERLALSASSLNIFPGDQRARLYEERYALRRPTRVVYNCARMREPATKCIARERLGLPKDVPIALYLGGVSDANYVDDIVTAWTEVPRALLVIVGWCTPEYRSRLEEAVARLGLGGRVIFKDAVNTEKWVYLDAADVSLCLYRQDALRRRLGATASNKILESVAAGTPVIAGFGENYEQFIARFAVGVCVPEPTASAIAKCAAQLLTDDQARARMASKALELHRSCLNYEHQAARAVTDLLRVARGNS